MNASDQNGYVPLRRKAPTTRYGSSPKLICYTQSNSARVFNYQRPPNEVHQELTGKSLRHVQPIPSRDIAQFRSVNINKLPNSKRTMVPELAVSITLMCIMLLSLNRAELKYAPIQFPQYFLTHMTQYAMRIMPLLHII